MWICIAIPQLEEDDTLDESSVKKSPFGSSFRTFDGTDYSNIGKSIVILADM